MAFNTYYSQYWNSSDAQVGGHMFSTMVHEIGHSLGLGHPHDNAYTLPGVSNYASTGAYGLNQNIYTVMSYNDVGQMLADGTAISPNSLASYGFQTMGALDIAAIQHLYGASSLNTGNNTYIVPSWNGTGTYYQTIWDTSGTDTIQYNGSSSVEIDLRAATLNFADGALAGGAVSKASWVYGGFTIANGVVIENATGGSGADVLTGNAADNVLRGNAGNDVLNGGAGSDTAVYSGASSGVVINLAGGGTAGGDGSDTLISIENTIDSAFNDTLLGSSVANVLQGGAGNDTIDGGSGNDILEGGDGNDQLIGGGGDDILDGGAGNDIIDGGS